MAAPWDWRTAVKEQTGPKRHQDVNSRIREDIPLIKQTRQRQPEADPQLEYLAAEEPSSPPTDDGWYMTIH